MRVGDVVDAVELICSQHSDNSDGQTDIMHSRYVCRVHCSFSHQKDKYSCDSSLLWM